MQKRYFSLFHGENRGSNPLGRAIEINQLVNHALPNRLRARLMPNEHVRIRNLWGKLARLLGYVVRPPA